MPSRRPLAKLAMISAASTLFASSAPAALVTNITNGSFSITLTRIGTAPAADNGVDALTYAVGDPGRLFVNGRAGVIELVKNGVLQGTPYLRLNGPVASGGAGLSILNSGGADERGFLGLAFHPDFNVAGSPGFGRFYTYTSEPIDGTAEFSHPEITAGTATRSYQNVVREFTVTPGTDVATISSSRVMFRIDKVQSNHNGGNIRFGPDGYLYIGTGDGGGGNDNNGGITSNSDGHTNNTGNGQDTTVAYGKILRIDPITGNPGTITSANGKYGIPTGNLFSASATQVKEIYAYGQRNPWRFSFDKLTGTLYSGDVGQGAREEVDVITNGGNFGWPYNEGSLQNSTYAAVRPPGFTDIQPIAEYTHSDGIAVIGGFIYRGPNNSALNGKYIFGDYVGKGAGPRYFYVDPADGITHAFTFSGGIQPSANISLFGFGEDADGNLYATMSNGDIYAINVPEPTTLATLTLAALALTTRRRRLHKGSHPVANNLNRNFDIKFDFFVAAPLRHH
jgi:glucose/arabinose dehydrogenase